jgi:hypothetical protein
MLLHNSQVGVFEGGIGKTISEFVNWLDASFVEMAVVKVNALGEILLRRSMAIVRFVHDVGSIILSAFGPGKWRATGRIDLAPEDVHEGISRFFTGHACPDDSGDIRMFIEIVQQHGTDRV